jgi:hypothetical protein
LNNYGNAAAAELFDGEEIPQRPQSRMHWNSSGYVPLVIVAAAAAVCCCSCVLKVFFFFHFYLVWKLDCVCECVSFVWS